ncbi:MAG: hypothetical protein DCC75_06685 [Proteobacteria bacterium]|nr:MAG: hypothetical protein DCC75_06685 [Pseudomonadota bacterium]
MQGVWKILLMTLPLDLLLLWYKPAASVSQSLLFSLHFALAVCVAAALTGILKPDIALFLARFRKFQEKAFLRASRYSILLVFIFAVLIFIEISSKLSASVWSLAVALVIVAVACRQLLLQIRAVKERNEKLAKDRAFQLADLGRQLYLINLLPLFGARGISIIGALLTATEGSGMYVALLYLGGSLAALLALEPASPSFLINCTSCGRQTSAVHKEKGLCPKCESERLNKKSTV